MLVQTRMNPNRKTRLWFAKHSTILHSIQQETSEVAHPSDETVENGSFSSSNVYSFSPFNLMSLIDGCETPAANMVIDRLSALAEL